MNEDSDWVTNVDNTTIIGTVAGPHPIMLVRDFASIIGQELAQMLQQWEGYQMWSSLVWVAVPMRWVFYPFINDTKVDLVGVEAGGRGVSTGAHAAPQMMERLVFCMAIALPNVG